MVRLKLFFISTLIILAVPVRGQDITRPSIRGVSRMTFLVSSFDVARNYYGRFLGFKECFSYKSGESKVISFKVNDRQFLEFIEDKDALNKNRMVSVSFDTDNPEQMRLFLGSKGISVPESVSNDGAGNECIRVQDPSGNTIEFMSYGQNSLHKKSKGKYLSEKRISERIHHVGLYAAKVMDNDSFWVLLLGFKPMWRYPEDLNSQPVYLYLQIPESVENIELLTSGGQNTNHPCLLVDDMQETIYIIRERRVNETLDNPVIGKGKRWLLNIMNEDKTKVEFTEAHTIK